MVRRLTSPRLEFEAAAIYEYPEHLRSFLNDLPTRPGVYLFHGESDTMPLYIGKSVNIRSRVLSHLRTPDEAAMLRQSRRISWICTAGEIGALLLEARLIKEQQPLFNKRLRRNRQLCALQLNEKRVDVVYAKEVDFSRAPNLFGLFANRRAALQALQTIADEQKLCYGLLGLEPLSRGRACFRSALKRCAGACCGKESHEEHALRLRQSLERLRVVCWPWQGAVALKEQHPEMTQYHIIQNWLWLGAVNSLEEATTLIRTPAGFDHDGYKILCKPLLSGNYEITELDPASQLISLNNSLPCGCKSRRVCLPSNQHAPWSVVSNLSPSCHAPLITNTTPPREPKVVNVRSAILTFALQTSRRVMMLKSIDICPAVSFAFTTWSAAKAKGWNGFKVWLKRSALSRSISPPSSNVTILSMPGNKENSPFAAMDAMLARQ